jgi:hypothetical protein
MVMQAISKDNEPELTAHQRRDEQADVSSHPDSFGQAVKQGLAPRA